jgi:hypothetical protein
MNLDKSATSISKQRKYKKIEIVSMCLSRSCNNKVFRDGGIINKRLKTVRCFFRGTSALFFLRPRGTSAG